MSELCEFTTSELLTELNRRAPIGYVMLAKTADQAASGRPMHYDGYHWGKRTMISAVLLQDSVAIAKKAGIDIMNDDQYEIREIGPESPDALEP